MCCWTTPLDASAIPPAIKRPARGLIRDQVHRPHSRSVLRHRHRLRSHAIVRVPTPPVDLEPRDIDTAIDSTRTPPCPSRSADAFFLVDAGGESKPFRGPTAPRHPRPFLLGLTTSPLHNSSDWGSQWGVRLEGAALVPQQIWSCETVPPRQPERIPTHGVARSRQYFQRSPRTMPRGYGSRSRPAALA